MKSKHLVSLFVILLAAGTLSAQLPYRLELGRVIVDEETHFDAWERATGTVDLTVDENTGAFEGARPSRWRRNINALQGDILAGMRANPPKWLENVPPEDLTILDAIDTGHLNSKDEVLNVFDDDPNTWWEPVFPEERSADIVGAEAFFTIDLGRVVVADKIVLKFVGEEDGDPFLLFDVFTSFGLDDVAKAKGQSPAFQRVFTTLQPNKSQREFEIDLARLGTGSDDEIDTGSYEPTTGGSTIGGAFGGQSSSGSEAEKRLVHFIRVVVNSSAYEQGREVTLEEYENLRQVAPQDTGMVEHTRRLSSGALIEVEPAVWEQLQGDSQGPIRYWQRERPRLAEIQVWGEGEDLFQGVQTRCTTSPGCVSVTHKVPGGPLFFPGNEMSDGDLTTKVVGDLDPGGANLPDLLREVFVDLSSMFWVESYRHTLNMSIGHSSSLGPWSLDFSDGSIEPDGSLEWQRVYTIEQTPTTGGRTLFESIDFEPVRARFMRLQWLQSNSFPVIGNDINLTEVQLMGNGYQPEVTMVSPAIELPGRSNLVSIEWEAATPPGTSVSLQTRTGTGLGVELCYYKEQAGQTTLIGCGPQGSAEAEAHDNTYNNLRFGAKQAGIEENFFVDETKFSPWSEVYVDPDGSAITSPSPRPVLLVQATLVSDDPDTHATLSSVTLNFDDPVANRLLGSVTPTRVEELGVDQAFSLVVQLDTLQLGLDELLVLPPAGMELVRDPLVLYAGTLAELEDGQDMSALSRDIDVLLPRQGTAAGDSLHLSFAAIAGARAPEAIRLEFTGRLFSPGGRLRAQLRNSQSTGGNWQRVDQERSSLVLLAQPEQKELFRDLALVPAAFSPNGDGANDEMRVSFTLLSVGVGTGVDVEVYDLSGRLVRRIHEERDNSTGAYAIPWNGRNDAGDLVAPGLYAVRVKLAGDTAGSGIDRVEELRTVAVAY